MKIKEIIEQLEYFDQEDELSAFAYDKDLDIEYECKLRDIDGDICPMLILDVVQAYGGGRE